MAVLNAFSFWIACQDFFEAVHRFSRASYDLCHLCMRISWPINPTIVSFFRARWAAIKLGLGTGTAAARQLLADKYCVINGENAQVMIDDEECMLSMEDRCTCERRRQQTPTIIDLWRGRQSRQVAIANSNHHQTAAGVHVGPAAPSRTRLKPVFHCFDDLWIRSTFWQHFDMTLSRSLLM